MSFSNGSRLKKKNKNKSIKLDIGCGDYKKEGYIGIDRFSRPGVDLVIELETQQLPYENNTVDEIYCSHLIEHLSDPIKLIEEFNRVLKIGGKLTLIVPHYTNPYACSIAHKTYWSLMSIDQEILDYYTDTEFILLSKQICVSFILDENWLDRLVNMVLNANQKFYERYLSLIYRVWEIRFVMVKKE